LNRPPTACIEIRRAGVDSAWEQKKREAEKTFDCEAHSRTTFVQIINPRSPKINKLTETKTSRRIHFDRRLLSSFIFLPLLTNYHLPIIAPHSPHTTSDVPRSMPALAPLRPSLHPPTADIHHEQ